MNEAHPLVGERVINTETMDLMPMGTRLADNNNQWVREEQGWHVVRAGEVDRAYTYSAEDFSPGGGMRVVSLPEGYVPAKHQITLAQLRWLVRDSALRYQLRNGVSRQPVADALRSLGIEDADQFPLGPGVRLSNPLDQGRLPNGTVLQTGHLSRTRNYGVFVKVNALSSLWRHLLGYARSPDYLPGTVLTMPGTERGPEWWTQVAVEDEADRVTEFSAQVWHVGMRLKSATGWCGEVERAMWGAGVDSTAVQRAQRIGRAGGAVGEVINATDARLLPIGSILEWVHHEEPANWALFVRSEYAQNAAGTARVMCALTGSHRVGHYASRMRVMYRPESGPMFWSPNDHDAMTRYMEAAHPGTRMRRSFSGTEYIKTRDRGWTRWDGSAQVPESGDLRIESWSDRTTLGFTFMQAE